MTIYRTAQGREIDMGKMVQKNELVQAVGNANVNARGDKLGAGGKIIARREEVQTAANQVPDQINVRTAPTPVVVPAAATPVAPLTPVQKSKNIKEMDPEGNDE
jgi:hypothetical protein